MSNRQERRRQQRAARKGAKQLRAAGQPVPAPGIDGTYSGSCIVCLEGTDTGLAFRGEAEVVLAGLDVLGVPADQAYAMMAEAWGVPEGEVPGGVVEQAFRVCSSCAEACPAPFPVGVFPEVPLIEHGGQHE